jgi:methionyl-tRNA synthetase
MKDEIMKWARSSNHIVPEAIKNLILSDLEIRKNEISVSRPADRISWGFSVPGDPSQTIYVWLDALVNYLTVLGYPDQMKYGEAEVG